MLEKVPGLLGTVSTTSTFNAADQLTARGNVTYSYDDNGNQLGSSAGQSLVYNGADQTTSLKKAGGSALPATYAGTSQVERTSAGATSFTNSLLGLTSATEGTATTATTRDPAGGLVGLRIGAGRSYYLFDGLGSVVAVTDASGNVTNSYTYDPYGVTTETTSSGAVANPWRYTGQYQDASTGLYKMGARYYQPELGRWSQPDPSGLDANPYAYAASDPINNSDPTGLYCVTGENPNGSCRSIARAVERAFVPPEGCAIFSYPGGSCFGGNAAEVLDRAIDRAGGLSAVDACAKAAFAGGAGGAAAGLLFGGAPAILTGPTAALGACVFTLGLGVAIRENA